MRTPWWHWLARAGCWCALLALTCPVAAVQHYIYFSSRGPDGAALRAEPALRDARFAGAQVAYTWRQLEPRKDQYCFDAIRADLRYLDRLGKQLWIQLQEKSFTPRANVPVYLRREAAFDGGVVRQSMAHAPERDARQPLAADDHGWVAKLWHPPVRARFQRLIRRIGAEFDGRIAGINLSESALDIGEEQSGGVTRYPAGFSPQRYHRALTETYGVLAGSFRRSVAMAYINFFPGEWLPWEDQGHLRGLFARAQALGMGVGGPDLMPYRPGLMRQSYALLRRYPQALVKALAVQDGNLRQINPRTGRPFTVPELLRFATQELGLDLLFWVNDADFRQQVLRDLPRP